MGIDKNNNLSIASTELRRKAEGRLKAKSPEACCPAMDDETQLLIYELEVHQIELEMQNAELRVSRYEIETALEKYTDLYEFAPVGYFTLDRNGFISSVNLAGACLLEEVRSRLIGRHFGAFVAIEARAIFSEFIEKVFVDRHPESCEVMLSTVADSQHYLQIEAVAFGLGEECRVAAIDITRRRNAEDELADNRRELEELNSSLAGRIGQAVEEMRHKDQILILQGRRAAMGEMIGNIAHQWRQPLNALGLCLQDLPYVYGKSEFNKEYLKDSVGKSMDLIMHMSRTIDDFRDFFRVDKEKTSFSVNKVIVRTLALIGDSFKNYQISIVHHSESDQIVSGYPNEYAQVLVNILMNASDALVGQNTAAARILIRSFAEGGKMVVTVTDNAGGIAEDIIDKVFDPYFTTKGPDKGTGIGLFMSKTIIEKNMGGKLTVHNAEHGAEFRVEL